MLKLAALLLFALLTAGCLETQAQADEVEISTLQPSYAPTASPEPANDSIDAAFEKTLDDLSGWQ